MTRQGKILGNIVSQNGITSDMDKIDVIVNLPKSKIVKEVQAFRRHYGYYCRFIHMYAMIVKPLYWLLVDFDWIEECN